MWKQEVINTGRIKTKVPITVKFEYLREGKFVSAKSSCGCSIPQWKDGNIEVVYTPNNIPEHLANKGITEYDSVKYIAVIMIEDSMQKNYNLQIQSKVYK